MSLGFSWARTVVACLVGAGVRDVVVSPGSRSTPLVLALAERDDLRLHVVLDERAAAFFALGQARVTGAPTVVLCTSGTAGAHHLPAVVEASLAAVPLLSLTADRPWELVGSGASQTIDQRGLFGPHVRKSLELGPPDPVALPHVPRIVAEAVAACRGPVPGPVHLDVAFRKPLEPDAADRAAGPPAPRVPAWSVSTPSPSEDDVVRAASCLRDAERGLIACGPWLDAGGRAAESVRALALATGFDVYAEVTSGARVEDVPNQRPHLGLELEAGAAKAAYDVVVELGLPPVSSAYAAMLASSPPRERFVVAPLGPLDPHGTATAHLVGDTGATAMRLALAMGRELAPRGPALLVSPPDAWGEGAIARRVVAALRPGDALFVGNSGIVRDVDRYAAPSARGVRVLHQRGAAGIDGNLAGAIGSASVHGGRLVALVGDLTFLHDAGSLALARGVTTPLTVVVVDNGGGRIFEGLPLARTPEGRAAMERFFVTPQGADLAAVARAYGCETLEVEGLSALGSALEEGRERPGVRVVLARVPSPMTTGEHARALRALRGEAA